MALAGSNRLLVLIAGIVAVMTVVAIAAAALTSGREPRLLPEDTPEGVVQRYLRAVQDAQFRQAYDYMSPDLTAECPYDSFLNTASTNRVDRIQASLAGTRKFDDRAEVTVSVTSFSDSGRGMDPFSGGGSAFKQTFLLRQVDGGWRFSQWPWPVWGCPRDIQKPVPAAVP